jgi:hypothetical protein
MTYPTQDQYVVNVLWESMGHLCTTYRGAIGDVRGGYNQEMKRTMVQDLSNQA